MVKNNGSKRSTDEDLLLDIDNWIKFRLGPQTEGCGRLFEKQIYDFSPFFFKVSDLTEQVVKLVPDEIIYLINQLIMLISDEQTFCSIEPYPFGRYHYPYRYIKDSILSVPESGASDLIEPCHEFKAFINTPIENQLEKFTTEVIRFAAACMNCRTNGTIHFGIIDKPHGKIVGVAVNSKEKYLKALKLAIDYYFEYKNRDAAHKCIKTPRFVEVLNRNITSSDKFVIEVDIKPQFAICGENVYQTVNMKRRRKKTREKTFYIRDGASCRSLFAQTTFAKPMVEYRWFVKKIPELSQRRKNAEEQHSKPIKNTTQSPRLINMITGGAFSMDKSNFEHYVIVTNKSYPSHFENLEFLIELKPVAVLDFDPESAKSGLSYFKQQIRMNPHLLAKYERMDNNNSVQLELFKDTNWFFCNGCVEKEEPSDIDQWFIDKGYFVHNVISSLCRREVVSWWNFHFSELPGLTPFIKRDKFDYIMNTVIPDLCSQPKACVLFNLLHLPGCGGTTLAMHVLWALRDKYRCAVLREKSDFVNVADQVIKLLMYQYDEQTPRVPVLLMIDDFDDMEKVEELQFAIETQFIEKDLQAAKVILLNCMRSEFNTVTGLTPDTVFIGNNLSDEELRSRKRTPE
ncbi:sterile alpha motif domain-containing protein 9-like [Xiphophorus hellerii]|uniref:sterile alpha motif domain-containing protein 9-like n=1 Tax=Xiphophorus hellerii TaxID=8084 RepID=UPI0013B412F7|nr:sterile alpha motif domain-containing protein 9-like [Xiphophorus hellerii]